MKKADMKMLLQTASRHNILILSTRCATACIFCSHNQNPPGIEAYYADDINEEEADTLIQFLDGTKPIVIGESATRICEGEPFLHKDIIKILRKLRTLYPHTPVRITTSAVPLNEALVKELACLGNMELNVSLNSATLEGRKKLYRGRALEEAIAAVQLLNKYKLRFNGSIVAMPHIVGISDIFFTAKFLSANGAETIRIFMPGYTKFTQNHMIPEDIFDSLDALGEKIRESVEIPVTVEPPRIRNLNAVIEGVIKGSPAYRAGLIRQDIIKAVNGENVFSRVDAYYKIHGAVNPSVTYLRRGEERRVDIMKDKKISSGLVMNYDIDPKTVLDIERVMYKHKGKNILLLTSELAFDVIKGCIGENTDLTVQKVKNFTFGGNIMCAGLLTIYDIKKHLEDVSQKPDVLILPEVMFDDDGRDLFGQYYMNIYEELGIKIETL